MFIYRDEYYHNRREPNVDDPKHEQWQMESNRVKNKSEIIIAKQRNGAVGTVELFFDSNTTTFANSSNR